MASKWYKNMIVDYKKGSIIKNENYLYNKASQSIYSFRPDMEWHDVNNLIEDLKNQWYELTKEEFKIYSLLSLLTSWWTISAIKIYENLCINEKEFENL